MTSQNNELRSQNVELRGQVDRYRMELDRLEKKLDKSRKKADMADLVNRFANHSISPQPPSVSMITEQIPTSSTFNRTPSPDLQSAQIPSSIPATDPFLQLPVLPVREGTVRFCPDGSEIWYPHGEMPGDYQLNVLSFGHPQGENYDMLS
jgi:hypothetical protein